jgi:hypothetical protein
VEKYSKSVDHKESPVVKYLNHVQSLAISVKEKFSGKNPVENFLIL